jgi:hypothetical protein
MEKDLHKSNAADQISGSLPIPATRFFIVSFNEIEWFKENRKFYYSLF